jgi:hypothetical protein
MWNPNYHTRSRFVQIKELRSLPGSQFNGIMSQSHSSPSGVYFFSNFLFDMLNIKAYDPMWRLIFIMLFRTQGINNWLSQQSAADARLKR